jgi:Ni,Fe-hydrogenase maturation factor
MVCINAVTIPENYIGRIAREEPETILIVDAAHLG